MHGLDRPLMPTLKLARYERAGELVPEPKPAKRIEALSTKGARARAQSMIAEGYALERAGKLKEAAEKPAAEDTPKTEPATEPAAPPAVADGGPGYWKQIKRYSEKAEAAAHVKIKHDGYGHDSELTKRTRPLPPEPSRASFPHTLKWRAMMCSMN